MADKVKFWPIRGTEEQILAQSIVDGRVYFAYDTNKIYLDASGERHPMGGGSSGILYADAQADDIIKEIPEDDADDKYFVNFSALEENSLKKKLLIDDLILNSDGRFFRILRIDNANSQAYCQLLAVSGSGGGGGSATYSNRSRIFKEDPESNYLINGRASSIKIYGVSGRDPEDGSQLDSKLVVHWTLAEKTSTGLWSVYSQNTFPITASTTENPIWEEFEFGTKARQSTTNLLTMWVTGSASTASRVFEYEFYTSELLLEKHPNFSNINTYSPNDVNIYCTTIGNIDKIIYYYFGTEDGEILLNKEGTVLAPGTAEQIYHVPEEYATHGAHSVRIELYQYVNGKADFTAAAAPIQMEIAVKDPDSRLPIIWLGDYQDEYYQYDNIRIPFRVYDPSAVIGTNITLYKDTNKLGERTITDNSTFSIWEIVDGDLGMRNYYSIACGQDENEVRREISFNVVEDPNRKNMKISTAGLKYSFDASGRSNSESNINRSTYIYGEGNDAIVAKFDGFNWYNNGWITDSETGDTCLRISNGAKFSIPLKQTHFATGDVSNQSHTFEFQFKVRNVQDYSSIVHNITRYKGNTEQDHPPVFIWDDSDSYPTEAYTKFNNPDLYVEWSNGKIFDNYDAFLSWYLPAYAERHPETVGTIPPSYDNLEYNYTEKILNTNYAAGRYYDEQHGICIGAQDALFTNGVNTVNVSYVEDKIVNLTVVYSHGDGSNGGSNKLMSIYLNGVLTGVTRSVLNDAWDIGNNDDISLIFDSKYCDFDLYKIRVYNQPLTLPTILTNYMVDLKDPVGYDLTQLAVLNNTINESQLSYESMIQYNEAHPDGYIMPYLIITTNPSEDNKLPWSKSRKLEDYARFEFVNTGLDRAYTTGELNQLAERAGQTVEEYYKHHCPSWIGDNITLQIQGTSSEFYPRRNYKAKTKDSSKNVNMYMNRGPFAQKFVSTDSAEKEETHLNFFYMDNDTVGTTKFTLKIDYMESSGTYNMGFANLVKNAYTHHPLYDYYSKGAMLKADTAYNEASSYTEGKTYYYKNHKGNWKNTTDDELKIETAEDFAMGPVAYAQSKGITKVLTDTTAAEYNKWYEAVIVYETASMPDYLDDYRTSVQGFPVLTFHQTTDANGNSTGIKYIGRYNMLLDKGSDEAFGFKPAEEIYQKFVTNKKGAPVKVSKVAECWEAENNSRGFCSFRDAATNRTDDKFFDTGTLTNFGAPIVADYWEYRYHDKADSLDVLYELKDKISDEKSIATVADEMGVDIQDTTVISSPDPNYVGTYTQGMANAGQALLDTYSNWERAVRWVYETDQDAVPSAGTYRKVDIGLAAYEPNTYFILNNESEYVLDDSAEYDSLKIYYKKIEEDEYEAIKLCASADLIYQANTYYILSTLGDYVLDPETTFNIEYDYYILDADEANSGAALLPEPVVYNGRTYSYDTKEYRNAKFTNDLTKHFNLEYLVTYFIMTEVFECYDSRGKNAMFASWGPQEAGGDYIWYPIFYDIDTQLGINNTGIPSFEYYVDATENGTFSTNDSILWNNLYKNFRGQIIQKYRQLRGANSTYPSLSPAPLQTVDRIENWYLADPNTTNSFAMRGERPLIAINLDEYYKYITITNPAMGYQDRNGGTSYDNGTYFYALQGDRSLSRQQFLTNRFNYIDSWLNQGNYERGGTNIIRGRVAANNPETQSDKWIDIGGNNNGVAALTESAYWLDAAETQKHNLFDGEYWINMEPVRNSYVTVGTDAANFPSLKYNNLEGPVRFITSDLENGVRKSGNYREQLYYIYGLDQMKSLGDMSRLYWAEFNIEGSAAKMTDLLLGYDGVDENDANYKNERINMYGIHASNSASDKGGMPLLKKINLSYIKFNDASPTYNFTSCEKLEDFRAIGSNITNVLFADGVALNTLYLPESIKRLELTEATKLNNIVTNFRTRKDSINQDVYPGLYIPKLTDNSDTPTSNIEVINIIGDHMGYDSYKLLQNYYKARRTAQNSAITMTEVRWTPYELLEEGAVYDETESELYFVDDGHFGFKAFDPDTYSYNQWNLLIKNGELYKLNTKLNKSTIKTAELLESLRDEANFVSAVSSSNKVPTITGMIYIDNDTAINENDIESGLVAYYPGLKFFFKNVEKVPAAKYVILNDDGTYDVLARKSLGAGETFFPNPKDLISSKELDKYDTRLKYDFYGWGDVALSPSGVEALNDREWYLQSKGKLIVTTNNPDSAALTQDQWYDNWSAQELEDGKIDYTFYAVYAVHKYIMTFLNGDDSVLTTVGVEADSYVPIMYNIVPYKNDSLLASNQTYHFTGNWKLENGRLLTENSIKSNRNYTFYPEFIEQSVYDSVTGDENFEQYFIFTTQPAYMETGGNIGEASIIWEGVRDAKYNIPSGGYKIDIKENVALFGKVTLPTYYKGLPIIKLGNSFTRKFSNGRANNITHIFWKRNENEPCMLRILEGSESIGYEPDMSLQYLEMPDGVRIIGSYFFRGFATIKTITPYENDGSVVENMIQLPESLAYIGSHSFNYAFPITAIDRLYLPGSVATIETGAFMNFNAVLNLLEIGSEENRSNLKYLGAADIQTSGSNLAGQPIYNQPNGSTKHISIYFKTSIQKDEFMKNVYYQYIVFNGDPDYDWHNI